MQRYVASNAQKVSAAGNHDRNSESRNGNSKQNQTNANPRRIQVRGKAYEPVVWKISPAPLVKTASPTTTVAGVVDPGLRRSTSAAQIASTRWKNGSHRKLQRNIPAVGIMHSKSTMKRR